MEWSNFASLFVNCIPSLQADDGSGHCWRSSNKKTSSPFGICFYTQPEIPHPTPRHPLLSFAHPLSCSFLVVHHVYRETSTTYSSYSCPRSLFSGRLIGNDRLELIDVAAGSPYTYPIHSRPLGLPDTT